MTSDAAPAEGRHRPPGRRQRRAAVEPKAYKNCKELNKVYKHGVARKGAKDNGKGQGQPVTTFTVYTKAYNLNKKGDKDKDGIACEKK